jgi:uncharacterized membrane protein
VLLSTDFIKWVKKSGSKTILSFVLAALGIIISAFFGVLIFKAVLPEVWKMAGMHIGGLTGATINFMAVGVATQISEEYLVLMGAAMLPIELPWMIFMVTVAKKVLGRYLLPYRDTNHNLSTSPDVSQEGVVEDNEWNNLINMLSKNNLLKTIGALILSICIFALSFIVAGLFPPDYLGTVVIVAVSVLGILASFVARFRKLDTAFPLGTYVLMIFAFTIATMADFRALADSSMIYVILFGVFVLYLGFLLHILFCKLFKIDVDTMLITNAGCVFSPAYVPVVATAIKNKAVIISGITAGLLGYAFGNLLGIGFAYLFKMLM